ncbi:hypothetical protein [Mangrovibacillus cuniculi]|nr:hypothetical protein [Mangrovibacillus cuniculi]
MTDLIYKAVFGGQLTTSFWIVLVIRLVVLGLPYMSARQMTTEKS